VNPLTWLVTTAATVLGGTCFPVEILPDWLKPISYAFPHVYVFEGLRKALLRGASLGALSRELAVLAAYAAVSVPIGALLLREVERYVIYKARKV